MKAILDWEFRASTKSGEGERMGFDYSYAEAMYIIKSCTPEPGILSDDGDALKFVYLWRCVCMLRPMMTRENRKLEYTTFSTAMQPFIQRYMISGNKFIAIYSDVLE